MNNKFRDYYKGVKQILIDEQEKHKKEVYYLDEKIIQLESENEELKTFLGQINSFKKEIQLEPKK